MAPLPPAAKGALTTLIVGAVVAFVVLGIRRRRARGPSGRPFVPKENAPYEVVQIPGVALDRSYMFEKARLKLRGSDRYLTLTSDTKAGLVLRALSKSQATGQVWSFNGKHLRNLTDDLKAQGRRYLRCTVAGTLELGGGSAPTDVWLFDGRHFYPRALSTLHKQPYRLAAATDPDQDVPVLVQGPSVQSTDPAVVVEYA